MREGPASGIESRRRKLLDAAVLVFARFGFRKTSMDEVARAAAVSRQGLYLVFPTKEDLFRATVRHALGSQLDAAEKVLRESDRPLDERLIEAFVEWSGRHIGALGAGASDLVASSAGLTGEIMASHEERLDGAVAEAIARSRLMRVYEPVGLATADLARTLRATALGLKETSATRDEFRKQLSLAVRALCAPLLAASKARTLPATKGTRQAVPRR